MEIGERIRCIRESKNITQAELANNIHVSSSYMSRLESGSSTPSIESVCSIAQALDVTPQDILCDIFIYTDDEPIPEKIKIAVQQLSPDRQLLFLQTLEFLSSRLKEL